MTTDITVRNEGSLVLIIPETDAASEWLDEHLSDEVTYWCGALVVEPRYFLDLLCGMESDGLVISC